MPAALSSVISTLPPRQTLVLSGPAAWGRAAAARWWLEGGAWLGDSAPEGISVVPRRQVDRLLGQDLPLLVIDAHAGLDPDALGVASGALVAGGWLVLLVPPRETWCDAPDPYCAQLVSYPGSPADAGGRFLRRLAEHLDGAAGVRWLAEPERLPDALPRPAAASPSAPAGNDQREVVAAVIRVATGHRRRPLVITADRGRGKSAALGLAAGELLIDAGRRILVTAPRASAVQTVFRHAAGVLDQPVPAAAVLHHGASELRFLPPDELLRQAPEADLLLVDEAAAIPVPLLSRMLDRYSRIVFASTVHGYEGSGRGFALRFRQVLDRRTPQWRMASLRSPMRYAPDDPLERWTQRALLLDAEPDDVPAAAAPTGTPLVAALSQDALAGDEMRLRQVFGLLVQAHYQTRPADLRQLLDAPQVRCRVASVDGRVIGVAWCAVEGGLDAAMADCVARGQRRPHGHLAPQSLAAHTGDAWWATTPMHRVVRLAVRADWQRRGIGTALLADASDGARAEGAALIGASFAADAGVIAFWQAAGFRLARVGTRRDQASGTYSATFARPLCDEAAARLKALAARTREIFVHGLADTWRDMDAEVVLALLACDEPASLDDADRNEAAAYAAGERAYPAVQLGLWRCALAAAARGVGDGVAVRRLLQRWPVADVVAETGLPGQRALDAHLRDTVAGWLAGPLA